MKRIRNSKSDILFQEGGADTREEAKQDVGPTHFQNVEFKLVQTIRVQILSKLPDY
jgi:hypothetical protein